MSSAPLFSLSPPAAAPPSWAPLTTEITTLTLQFLPTSSPYTAAVTTPIRRLITSAPSSVAPALCVAACELVGGTKSQAMHAACAVQLMHAVTQARARNAREGGPASGVELMAEDAMLPLGFELVGSAAVGEGEEERVVRAMREMGRVMGPQGVVEGQLLEVEGGGGEEWWLWERKEGRMAACGAAMGAILGGGSEERVERMRRFGMYVGMMMMVVMVGGGTERRREEVIEVFRSLARLELQGLEERKVEEVLGSLGLGISNSNTV